MNKKSVIAILILASLLGALYWYRSTSLSPASTTTSPSQVSENGSSESDTMQKPATEDSSLMPEEMEYSHEGVLADVTDGQVRGINTNQKSSGAVKATFADGTYTMVATFEGLPDPLNGDFYEGWLLQKNPFDVISTGKAEKIDGVYTNVYTSKKDFTSYSQYILTIEPDDGDPIPADHVVEGEIERR